MSWLRIVSCLFPVFFCTHATAESIRTVVYALPHAQQDPDNNYYVRLLKAALEHADGSFEVQSTKEFMVQGRALREIGRGNEVDVSWSMTSPEREEILHAVPVPIDKGLIGWRVLLVRQPEPLQLQQRNKQQFRFVQGHDWPDTQILQHNGLRVETTAEFSSLFAMVSAGRVDAMPRSVLEFEDELQTVASSLFVAPDVLLYYPAVQYFFVAKEDKELTFALEQGLQRVLDNGIFDQLFEQEFGKTLQWLEQQHRQVLILENPWFSLPERVRTLQLLQPLPSHFEHINWQ
ncbi:transporter substrate-binding domain-containing protein [Alkalimonas collagenimarina]|uniref:Transporter substrate-binding domain-containing protein n=1 Tax=Alkalimonas collagenimarina TaxID=400390 RepID=A0ABT9GZ45_9GAMM|nr:transporter substrate-binding domain-containing protein [Alkalimonas collagenimarina]MDP4536139.1 transporter substrate-binding domain-containing protein [Alkalimonas collagenimarina]